MNFGMIRKFWQVNESQCQLVLISSIKTIKMLENKIRSDEISTNTKTDFYKNKLNQLMTKIDYLKDQKNLKSVTQQFSKAGMTEPKLGQSKNFQDQVVLSFNQLIAKITFFVEEQKMKNMESVNTIKKEKEESQAKLQQKINTVQQKFKDLKKEKEVSEKKLREEIKTFQKKQKDESEVQAKIKNLKDQISDLSSKLKAQKGSNKQLVEKLTKRDEEIIMINKFSSKVKKVYQEQYANHQAKVKQLSQLVQKVTSQLKVVWQQKKIVHETKSEVLQINNIPCEQSSTKEQIQNIIQQLKQKQDELAQANNAREQLSAKLEELDAKYKLLLQAKEEIESTKIESTQKDSTIEQNIKQSTQKDNIIAQLRQQVKFAKQELEKLKREHQLLQSTKNERIALLKGQWQIKLSKSNSLINQIINALQSKINKKVTQEQLTAEIASYQPPVGMKLIYSSIFLGQDTQRSQTLQLCEQFAGKRIKKTERLGRFPDTTSIVHQAPKQNNNFPFMMLYKTTKGTVFGSFTLKLKEPTFFFSFRPSLDEQSKVRQWMPVDSSPQSLPVDFVQGKYIQYGSGELKLNCIDLKTISANSVAKGYFNLDWKQITNESDESKISLSEVELHRVEFVE